MSKKFTFKKIAIVSVILIVVGLILYGSAFFATGGKLGARLTNDGWKYNYSDSAAVTKDTVPSFKNLDIQIKYRRIKLIESNEFAIEVRSSEKLEYEVIGDTLKIVDTEGSRSGIKGFNASILNFDIGIPYEEENQVNIYYPKNTEFGKILINLDSSGISLYGVKAKELVSNGKSSAINLENSVIDSISAYDNSAAFNIEGVQAEKVEIDLKYGALNVTNLKVKETIKVTGDAVALNFEEFESKKFDINNKHGAINITGATLQGFDLINNSGMVSVEGVISGNINIDTKFGNVNLQLEENSDNYKLITNEKFAGINFSGGNNPDGKYTIDVSADSTNVNINID